MQRLLKSVFFLGLFSFIIISCSKDKLAPIENNCTETITYNENVKDIINNSCAYTGCHATGFIKGDHSTFNSLKPQLDNGLFEKWVLKDRSMPPSYAPSGKPTSLTQEEIQILNCWVEQGYLEK